IHEKLVADPKGPPSGPRDLAATYQALADLHNEGGTFKDAVPLLQKGRDLLEKGGGPQTVAGRAVLARTYDSLGQAQMGGGHLSEALKALQKAGELHEQLAQNGPPSAVAESVDSLLQRSQVLDQL